MSKNKWCKRIDALFKGKLIQFKPPFPSTFVFEDYVYDQWNQDLIDNYGWTKKEIKQGWRYKK